MTVNTDRLRALVLVVTVGFMTVFAVVAAQAGELDPYKKQGLVGERPDGYAGIVAPNVPAEVRNKVQTINAKRRQVYEKVAKDQNTSVEAVGAIFAKKIIARQPSGTYIMQNGQWVKKP